MPQVFSRQAKQKTRCQECQFEMRIISFIVSPGTIRKILKYLDLWEEEQARDPPVLPEIPNDVFHFIPCETLG